LAALTLAALGFGACAPAMAPYRYAYRNHQPGAAADLRVGVLPAEDRRGAPRLDDHSDGLAFVPGFLWWSSYYDRPEAHAEGGSATFGSYATDAAVQELDGLRLFRLVAPVAEGDADVDLVLRTTVYETK